MEFSTKKKFEYIRDHEKIEAEDPNNYGSGYYFEFLNPIIQVSEEEFRLYNEGIIQVSEEELRLYNEGSDLANDVRRTCEKCATNLGLTSFVSVHVFESIKTSDIRVYSICSYLPQWIEGDFEIPWTHHKKFKTAIEQTTTEEINTIFDNVLKFDKASKQAATSFPFFQS